jgi:hypothetical protein
MIYARVHDRTVAEDYYAAMAEIEKNLDLAAGQPSASGTNDAGVALSTGERVQLLELIGRLAEPQLDAEVRMSLIEQIRQLLTLGTSERVEKLTDGNVQQRRPP